MFRPAGAGPFIFYVKNTCRDPEKEWKWSLKDVLLQPQIIAAGFLIGVFHWSNYWDFIIYFVVIAGFALYGALYRYHARAKETIGTVLLQAAEVFAIGIDCRPSVYNEV